MTNARDYDIVLEALEVSHGYTDEKDSILIEKVIAIAKQQAARMEELNNALDEAKNVLVQVCTLQVTHGDNVTQPTWEQILNWRVEMAREYCIKHGLLNK